MERVSNFQTGRRIFDLTQLKSVVVAQSILFGGRRVNYEVGGLFE
jgi:hypothetical protein